MTWNYRLVLHDLDADPEKHWIAIHEVYYDENKTISSWTEDPIQFICEATEGPEGVLKSMELALSSVRQGPMLVESDLKKFQDDEEAV